MFYEVVFKGIASGVSEIEPITIDAYANGGYTIDYETFEKYGLSDFFIKFNDELIYVYSKNPLGLHILGGISTIYGLKKPPLFGEAALV